MNKAKEFSNTYIFPNNEKFLEKNRHWQGIPTIAVTKGGRIFAAWYSGGEEENYPENYCILVYSDDEGKNWSQPIFATQGSIRLGIHTIDMELWLDQNNRLHIFWVQNNIKETPEFQPEHYKPGQPVIYQNGILFDDFLHQTWETIIEKPDDEITFTEPKFKFHGFLRNKPYTLKNGKILYPSYTQISKGYDFHISTDNGNTFTKKETPDRLFTDCDEACFCEKKDGTIILLARSHTYGHLGQSFSYDNGDTWTKATVSNIQNPTSRFYFSKLPNGNFILINNDHQSERTNMTIYLSFDEGTSWHKKILDSRPHTSYPEADFYNGKIYVIYDRERFPYYGQNGEKGACEICFAIFTEEDILSNKIIPIKTISRLN